MEDEDVEVPHPDTWDAIEDMIHAYVWAPTDYLSAVAVRSTALGGTGSDVSKFSRKSH